LSWKSKALGIPGVNNSLWIDRGALSKEIFFRNNPNNTQAPDELVGVFASFSFCIEKNSSCFVLVFLEAHMITKKGVDGMTPSCGGIKTEAGVRSTGWLNSELIFNR
jgi:hypothetical protein